MPQPQRQPLITIVSRHPLLWYLILAAGLLAIVFRAAVFNGLTLTSISSFIGPYSFYSELDGQASLYDQNALLAGDNERVWNPVRRMLHHQLSQGSLPLWNPAAANGMPLLAEEQTQATDPVNLLLCLLFPGEDSVVFFVLLSFLLAGLWMFLLARQLDISCQGSVITGVCYMFSGPLVAWYMRPNTQTYVYLPLLFLAFEKGWRATDRVRQQRWLLVAAAAVAMMLLSGHSQMVVLGMFCYLLLLGHRCWLAGPRENRPGTERQRLAWLLLPALIGAGLAAYKVLPFVELSLGSPVLHSGRGGMLPLTWDTIWQKCLAGGLFLHPVQTGADLLKLFLPFFFGSPATGQHLPFGQPYYQPAGANFAESASYFGILPLLFALAMLFSYRRLAPRLRSYAVCLLFGFAICYNLPVINLVRALPVLNLIKLDRLYFIMPLAGAVLAGKGFDSFIQWRAGRRLALLLVALTILTAVFLGLHLGIPAWSPIRRQYYYAAIPLAILLAATFFAALNRITDRAGRLLPTVILLLVILDSLHFAHNFMAFQPPELLHPVTARSRLLAAYANPVYRLKYLGFFLPSFNFAYPGLLMDSTFSVLQIGRHDELVRQMGRVLGAETPPHHGTVQTTAKAWLDTNSIGLVGIDRRMQKELAAARRNADLIPLYIDDDLLLFENKGATPRFSLYNDYATTTSARETAEKLVSGNIDSHRTLLIDQRTPATFAPDKDIPDVAGDIRVVKAEHDTIILEVDTDRPAILAVTDTRYPGWQASVDGASVAILQVNHAFKGIGLNGGRHTVILRYRPLSFRAGWLLSLATAVVAAAGWFRGRIPCRFPSNTRR